MAETIHENHLPPIGEWAPGKICIIGGGSWATALAKILLDSGVSRIGWFFRFNDTIKKFKQNKHNPSYLTAVTFDTSRIDFYSNIHKAIEEADTILLVTPSPYILGTLEKVKPEEMTGRFVLIATKGIIPDKYRTISSYLNDDFGIPLEMIGVISGPTHAEEIALEKISYLTVACSDHKKAEALDKLISAPYVRSYVSLDVNGIEYGTVLKNIYAIAAGICQGLKLGDNFQAVLITNAAAEMDRFTKALSTTRCPITDSVYLGDLLVTCYSKYSRNRTLGNLLGRGYSVMQAQLEMEMIAEGYYGAKCIHILNKRVKAFIPIAETVYQILYHKENAQKAIEKLTGLIH